MSTRSNFAAAAMALAATLTIAATEADHKGVNTGPKGSGEAAAPVHTAALADRLARYAIKSADPVAMVQAAKMKLSIVGRVLGIKKKTEGKGTKVDKTTGIDVSPEALLKRAAGMAVGNTAIIGLIADARAAKTRGTTHGPSVHEDDVLAGGTDIYEISFRGGEQAAVFVNGDGDTDLDLVVQDEHGNEICADADDSDTMLCRWTPSWTGRFQIRIKNLGRVYNHYEMAVN